MSSSYSSQRSLLQRRNSMTRMLQTLLDGAAVLGIAYFLIVRQIGAVTAAYTVFVLLLMGTLAVVYDHFGIYRSNANFTRKALNLFNAWSLTFLIVVLLGFLSKNAEQFSRLFVGELYVAGYGVQLGLHLLVWLVQVKFMQRLQAERVIIVGSGRLANYLQGKISNNPWLNQQVVGSVALSDEQADEAQRAGADEPVGGQRMQQPGARRTLGVDSENGPQRAPFLPHSQPHSGAMGQEDGKKWAAAAPSQPTIPKSGRLLGRLEQLPQLIEQHKVSIVYFAIPLDASEILENLYFKLLEQHVAIHWVPDIFSLRLVNHSVREIAGLPVIALSETPLTGTRLALKSLEDLLLSSLILLAIAPLLLVIALAVKLDSPGPVFFRQARNGWNGKTFRIWKFRSMYVHQPEAGVIKQAEKDDPRVTRVGRFIRRTSLDELPQIFNVFMGDMSLVGPRPHAVQHDAEYSQRISDYMARHNIKPGITGLAQVRGFRGETRDLEQMALRVESDIEYINHWSVWLDLSILLRTLVVFTGKNAY